jgi:O-antigen ligase
MWMVWFGFMFALEAIVQLTTSPGRIFWIFPSGPSDYVMGPILYHNHYAAFVEVVLPMALYEAFSGKRQVVLYAGISAALYASVVASASRAGAVLTTVEVFAVIVLIRKRDGNRRFFLPVAAMAAICLVAVVVVGPQHLFDRLRAPDPWSMRRELAISSLRMVAAHPWFGSGLGTWASIYPAYALTDFGVFVNRAHSDWLQWAAEGGAPFASLIGVLFLCTLQRAVRTIWALGTIAVFLHALVDYPFSRPALAAWTLIPAVMAWNEEASLITSRFSCRQSPAKKDQPTFAKGG